MGELCALSFIAYKEELLSGLSLSLLENIQLCTDCKQDCKDLIDWSQSAAEKDKYIWVSSAQSICDTGKDPMRVLKGRVYRENNKGPNTEP